MSCRFVSRQPPLPLGLSASEMGLGARVQSSASEEVERRGKEGREANLRPERREEEEGGWRWEEGGLFLC